MTFHEKQCVKCKARPARWGWKWCSECYTEHFSRKRLLPFSKRLGSGICPKCGEPNKRNGALEGSRRQSYCNDCHNAYMRANRRPYSEMTPEQKAKDTARSYANVYQAKGKILPQPCEVCGAEPTEKHHDDYSKPLEVRWFCRRHHLEHHRRSA